MADTERKKRILLAKSQIDAHDRGIRYIARKLMEAGQEVIFIRYGLPDEIAYAELKKAGVAGVFGPGSNPADIIDIIERSVSKKPSA